MDYQQEPRQFFGGSMIQMPMADFVKEHNDLIHILRHGSAKERAAEAASQEKELKSKRGGGPRYSRLENTLDRVGDDIVNVFIDEEDRPRYDPIAEAREAEEQRERLRERREREARAADIRNNPAFNTARRRRREAQRRRAARRGRGIALSSDEEESSDEENIEGGGNCFGRMVDDSGDCFRFMYEDAVAPFYTAQQYRDRVRRLNRNIRRNLKERQKDEIKVFFDIVRGYYNYIGRPLTPTQYANVALDLYYKHVVPTTQSYGVNSFRNMGPFSEAKFKDEVRRLAGEADADPSAPVVPLPSAPIPAWAMGDIDQNPSGVSLPGAVEENDIRVPTITEPDAVGSGIASDPAKIEGGGKNSGYVRKTVAMKKLDITKVSNPSKNLIEIAKSYLEPLPSGSAPLMKEDFGREESMSIAPLTAKTDTKKSYWLKKANKIKAAIQLGPESDSFRDLPRSSLQLNGFLQTSGEVKHGDGEHYVAWEWNEKKTTPANKDIEYGRDHIELKKKIGKFNMIVELQSAKPWKQGGDWETSILIYSKDYPDIYKLDPKRLIDIAIRIIKEQLG